MPKFQSDEIDAARRRLDQLVTQVASAPSLAEAQHHTSVVEGYAKALGDLEALPWTECNKALLKAQDSVQDLVASAKAERGA